MIFGMIIWSFLFFLSGEFSSSRLAVGFVSSHFQNYFHRVNGCRFRCQSSSRRLGAPTPTHPPPRSKWGWRRRRWRDAIDGWSGYWSTSGWEIKMGRERKTLSELRKTVVERVSISESGSYQENCEGKEQYNSNTIPNATNNCNQMNPLQIFAWRLARPQIADKCPFSPRLSLSTRLTVTTIDVKWPFSDLCSRWNWNEPPRLLLCPTLEMRPSSRYTQTCR